jgi:hypothetical protein
MILKIYQGQTELKINLVEPGKYGRKLASTEGVRLVIVPPEKSPYENVSKIIRRGEWRYPLPVEDYPCDYTVFPTLVYPCFDIDSEGALIFRLDKHLFKRPCGRYIAKVWIGPYEAARIDMDLMPHNYIVQSIEKHETQGGCR